MVKIRIPAVKVGVSRTTVTVEERGRGVDRKNAEENPLLREERTREIVRHQTSSEGQWAVGGWSMQVTMSRRFQALKVEAKLDLPTWVRTDTKENTLEDAKQGVLDAKAVIEEILAGEFENIDATMEMVANTAKR